MSSAWLSSLAKISVLGTSLRPGKMAEGADDGADLVAGDDAAVQLVRIVGEVLVRRLPAQRARLPVAVAEHRVGVGFDCGPVPGDSVFHDLPPQGVDRTVHLVDHDHVEVLGRVGGVVDDRKRLGHRRAGGLELRALLRGGVELRLPLEHRVDPLDRCDDDPTGVHDVIGGQPLDVVKLGEEPVAVGRAVALELLLGLLAEVLSVHEEEHATRPGVLDEPVDRGDRRDRLPRPGGHLHERARAVALEGVFQVRDGFDLVRVEEARLKGWQRLKAPAKGGRARGVGGGVEAPFPVQALHPGVERLGADPLVESLRSVNVRQIRGDGARLRLPVKKIDEARLHAGAEVEERERIHGRAESCGEAGGVLVRLQLDVRQGVTGGLGFQ